jgi:hypothetical protein
MEDQPAPGEAKVQNYAILFSNGNFGAKVSIFL